jgi:hypothetical protein
MLPMGRLLASVALVCAPIFAVASAGPESATGTLTVHGVTTPLRYAYAWTLTDPRSGKTEVLLTNSPLPAWSLTQKSGKPVDLCELAVAGKLQALGIGLDEQGQVKSATVFHYLFTQENACVPLYPREGDEIKAKNVVVSKGTIAGMFDVTSSRDAVSLHAQFTAPVMTLPLPLAAGEHPYDEEQAARAATSQRKVKFSKATGEGTLTINGIPTMLRYAYAGRGWNTYDRTQRVTFIILTETPLPERALSSSLNDLNFLGQTTGLQGIIAEIDERNQISMSWVMHHAYGESGGATIMGRVTFKPTMVNDKMIKGTLHDEGGGFSLKESYDASFMATLPKEAK